MDPKAQFILLLAALAPNFLDSADVQDLLIQAADMDEVPAGDLVASVMAVIDAMKHKDAAALLTWFPSHTEYQCRIVKIGDWDACVVSSDFVNRVRYNESIGTLDIHMRTSYYRYEEVPRVVFDKFIWDSSPGRFYREQIKRKFPRG